MNETLYDGRYFAIVSDETHGEFVRAGDEVLVVPLTAEGDVVLAVEPSAAFEEPARVLPGGETKEDEPHADTAGRELQEEVGYRAGRLEFVGELRPFSKYLTTRSFVFLARDLVPSAIGGGDERYEIGSERVPLACFEREVAAGRLLDARVVAALALARHFIEERQP
jgi:8-oxo-dGTP pyrophosphatase MutT (NUDIX family)